MERGCREDKDDEAQKTAVTRRPISGWGGTMTNSNRLLRGIAPSSLRGLARTAATPSPIVAEVARLQGEVRRLESVLRARESSTALVLHELRQPLSVLMLAAAYLAKASVGPAKLWASRVHAAALQLDGLIADLNDTSFLDSGRFTLQAQSTDVTGLVAESVTRLGWEATISVEGDIPRVALDPRRVEQILTNLLSNARKYGSPSLPTCVRQLPPGSLV